MMGGVYRQLAALPDESEPRLEALGQLLHKSPYCLDAWTEYIRELRRSAAVPLPVYETALHHAGVDPRAAPLWAEAIEAAACDPTGDPSLLLQSALCVPLWNGHLLWSLHGAYQHDATHRQRLLNAYDTCQAVLRAEGKWPDFHSVVCPKDKAAIAALKDAWGALLRGMFTTLLCQKLDRSIQTRRIELAFSLMTCQLPFDDSLWRQYATFVLVQMNNRDGAVRVLRDGLAHCDGCSVALASSIGVLGKSDGSSLLAGVPSELVRQRELSHELPASKKAFRDIGKQAESRRVTDWRVYHQWALLESTVVHDRAMAAKVLERGLACTAENFESYDHLSRSSESVYTAWHAEGELLNSAEKRVEAGAVQRLRGYTKAAWNRMMAYERKLGIPASGKLETRAAAATMDRGLWPLQQASRYRVGTLLTLTPRELDFFWMTHDLNESLAEMSPDTIDVRSDKHERLETSVSVLPRPVQVHPSLSLRGWTAFVPPVNPNPPSDAADCAEDEVCGPRSLRGTLVHKPLRDDCVEARLAREAAYRAKVRALNERRQAVANSMLPLQLQKLDAAVRDATATMPEDHVALLGRLRVSWLMQLLSTELELGLVRLKQKK